MAGLPRGSRSTLLPRDSVYPGAYGVEETCPASLEECVAALEDACEELAEAQELIRHSTRDYLRIAKILNNQRVFLLIDEPTVDKYKKDLSDEVEPCINELIARAERGIQTLEQKQSSLQTKIKQVKSKQQAPAHKNAPRSMEERRIQQAVERRQRLENELASLTAEVEEMESQMNSQR